MSFESFIAFKHLTRRRKSGFVSIVTTLTVLGIGIGVAVLIVVLAVMRGFDADYKSIFVNVQPHLRIDRLEGIDNADSEEAFLRESVPGVKTVAGFVEGQGMLQSGERTAGIMVRGIDVENEDLSIYQDRMRYGRMDFSDDISETRKRKLLFFKSTQETVMSGMVIGEGLAYKLNARVGDLVTLVTPAKKKDKGLSFGLAESHVFIVKGIFSVGLSDFDASLALIGLPRAQEIFHLGSKVHGISLRFADVDQAPQYKEALRSQYGGDYYFRTWHDLNAVFFKALEVERSLLHILLAFIVLVAGFNITSILILVVTEKTKDIGILRAIGATRASIRKIFLIQGFFTGSVGVLFGSLSGLLVIWYRTPIRTFLKDAFGLEIFPSDVYYLKVIPAEILPIDLVFVVGFALFASIVAGFYPAHRAASRNPVQALHYE